ncbi:hypothetical protein ACEUA8_01500 [Aeromonas veronii]
MGKKSKQSTPNNKMALDSVRNSLFTRSNYAEANAVNLGTLKELSEKEAIAYGGLPVMLMTVTFNNGQKMHLTTGALDVYYNNITYKSTSEILSIPDVKNEDRLRTDGVTVEMSGLNETLLDLIQSGQTLNARLEYKIVFLKDDNKVNGNAAFDVYVGFIRICETTIDYNKGSMTMRIETANALKKLERIQGHRHANSVQQSLYPGDKFFEYVIESETEQWRVGQR